MQYLGGKSKIASQIAGYLNNIRKPSQPYWEPFVGAGWVLEHIHNGPIFASDLHWKLIQLWLAVQSGWIPPEMITEDDYKLAKNGELPNALTAFIGFGSSWGGKWFAGFARNGKGRNYTKQASQSIVRKFARMDKRIKFFHADFFSYTLTLSNCLIYCDPPYENTTGYSSLPSFDTKLFWKRVRQLEAGGHTVIVSESQAPDDFSCVLEMLTKTNLDTDISKTSRVEKLFRLGDYPKLQSSFFDMEQYKEVNCGNKFRHRMDKRHLEPMARLS